MSHTYDDHPRPNCSTKISTTEDRTPFVQFTDEDGNVCHLEEGDLRWMLREIERQPKRSPKECRDAAETVSPERPYRTFRAAVLRTASAGLEGAYETAIERIYKAADAGFSRCRIGLADGTADAVARRLAQEGFRVTRPRKTYAVVSWEVV